MHDKHISHGNIKPSNIAYKISNSNFDDANKKIIPILTNFDISIKNDSEISYIYHGTPGFMSYDLQ